MPGEGSAARRRKLTVACAVCEWGGGVVECGLCLTAFHPDCMEEGDARTLLREGEEHFTCSSCRHHFHECFLCKEGAPDRKLLRCDADDCGLHFHPSCMRRMKLAVSVDPEDDSVFLCPHHTCAICKVRATQLALCCAVGPPTHTSWRRSCGWSAAARAGSATRLADPRAPPEPPVGPRAACHPCADPRALDPVDPLPALPQRLPSQVCAGRRAEGG